VQEPQPEPVWVRIGADGAHHVNGVRADLESLDGIVLQEALAANPSLSPETARAEVRVYVHGEPNAPNGALLEAVQNIHFRRVGFVAEERRT
jgi:hypothetical protein